MSKGRLVELSVAEAEKILIKKLEDAKDDPIAPLWELGHFYNTIKQHDKAMDCLRRILELVPDAERRATCILAMGQTMEEVDDYEAAVRYYREALSLEPVRSEAWYLINNNLGYSLNALGNNVEGELFCRKAIGIDPTRPNGHKNLGIALVGQGRLREAAQAFVTATRVCPGDRRSFDHLLDLLVYHPEFYAEFLEDMEWCDQAVRAAALEAKRASPVVHRGFWKHLYLLRMRLPWLFRQRR